jgi:AraC-like DNA-binding protein
MPSSAVRTFADPATTPRRSGPPSGLTESDIPSTSVRMFTDPDEYAAALHQGPVELTVAERGIFSAKLCTLNLHSLRMQRLSEDLARTSHVDARGGRGYIAFRTQPGPTVIRNGVELSTTSIARLRPGQSYYQHTAGPTSHAGMSLPLDEMASLGAAVAGCDLTPPDDDLTVTPSSYAMERLQRLCAAVGELAEHAPAVLEHPEAARGLEQALIEALINCLGGGEVEEERAALRKHAVIMRRFYRAIQQYLDKPLYVPDLCQEIGASERTLRVCCLEHLGMGPKHYLLLRRMHMARRALRESSPTATTVTEIATRYGFWQFGRFAGVYKELFGESPSTMLDRAPRVEVKYLHLTYPHFQIG